MWIAIQIIIETDLELIIADDANDIQTASLIGFTFIEKNSYISR